MALAAAKILIVEDECFFANNLNIYVQVRAGLRASPAAARSEVAFACG